MPALDLDVRGLCASARRTDYWTMVLSPRGRRRRREVM